MEGVNKSDSGDLRVKDILSPEGFILLSFVMDPRTGLGRFKDFRISNYELMEDMIQHCRTKTIEEILFRFCFKVNNLIEFKIDESVKHFYAKQKALNLYEKFYNTPFIYGIHLSR